MVEVCEYGISVEAVEVVDGAGFGRTSELGKRFVGIRFVSRRLSVEALRAGPRV